MPYVQPMQAEARSIATNWARKRNSPSDIDHGSSMQPHVNIPSLKD
jgi:hypothetical protein